MARQECAVRPETDAQRQSGVRRGRKPPRNAPGGFHGSPRTKDFTYRQITKRENGYRRTSKEGKSHFLYQTRRSGFDRAENVRIRIDDIGSDHVRLTEHSTVEEHSQREKTRGERLSTNRREKNVRFCHTRSRTANADEAICSKGLRQVMIQRKKFCIIKPPWDTPAKGKVAENAPSLEAE